MAAAVETQRAVEELRVIVVRPEIVEPEPVPAIGDVLEIHNLALLIGIEVPLAHPPGAIAGVVERVGDADLVVTGSHVVDDVPGLERLPSGDQHRSIGRAQWTGGDDVAEPDPFARDAVDVRGRDLALAIRRQGARPELIGQQIDDVRLLHRYDTRGCRHSLGSVLQGNRHQGRGLCHGGGHCSHDVATKSTSRPGHCLGSYLLCVLAQDALVGTVRSCRHPEENSGFR